MLIGNLLIADEYRCEVWREWEHYWELKPDRLAQAQRALDQIFEQWDQSLDYKASSRNHL